MARGVRFSNGPFLDLHQAPEEGRALLGLAGKIGDAEALAGRQGWRARAEYPPEKPDASPWSLLSFRRDQGILSVMFVIDYATEPQAWASPIFNGGLYHRPAGQGAALRRVWLTAADPDEAGKALQALGFVRGGEALSSVAPHAGWIYRGEAADIVVASGEDAVVRFDVEGDGPPQAIRLGAQLTAVVGRERPESLEG